MNSISFVIRFVNPVATEVYKVNENVSVNLKIMAYIAK
jgi:hypothetical protein